MRPRSIAVIGGGAWCANVIRECEKIGFAGDIWAVHPTRGEVAGIRAYPSIAALPSAPDAAFIGVNRDTTIGIVEQLSRVGAGGAVCFASGFREASAELEDGNSIQDSLVAAAGDMPILGPNCYGFVNALDGAALWPDVHGAGPCETGVAFIGQSSNVAINISMQTRGLPLAYVVTCGNQAQIGMAEIGEALLSDPRVTALGLHIEGVNDLRAYEKLAFTATQLGKPVVVMKVGSSDQAQLATVSHTASLAGSDAGARALMRRLGFALADDPASFVETLKVLHVAGGLLSNRILSMSCSGGEASLMADLGQSLGVAYPPLAQPQKDALRAALGPKVALANPLDYHTYIWGDEAALTACFSAGMAVGDLALGCVVLDFPRQDRFDAPDWAKVVDAVIATREATGRPMAVLASFAEGMPEGVSERLIQHGVVPLCGMSDGLKAIAAAAQVRPMTGEPLLLPNQVTGDGETLDESTAKAMLTEHGLRISQSQRTATAEAAAEAADAIGYPVVLKGMGFAHKTEAGAVRINLTSAHEVQTAAEAIPCNDYLVEEMVTDAVAELLVGVLCDPVHGFVLTIGAGGVMTEILQDTVSLLLPSTKDDITEALTRLRCYPLLTGYRGKPAADIGAIVEAVMAVQDFVTAHQDSVQEIEINPLLCCPDKAVAVDALIRMGGHQ
nr:acetate--CoA ligase family protein [Marivivens donghaensis]